MEFSSDFLLSILKKYALPEVHIQITDETTRVLASTDETEIGANSGVSQYILRTMVPAKIETAPVGSSAGATDADIAYGTPFFSDEELMGAVIAWGSASVAVAQGNMIRAALETAYDYQKFCRSTVGESDGKSQIARNLLSNKLDVNKVTGLMHENELDPQLLRCVININFVHHQTSYFNNNLSLGYQSAVVRMNKEVAEKLRNNKYLNSQDLVYIYDRNTIAVIKSFIAVEDMSRVYQALDRICESFEKALMSISSFSFSIAYGNIYSGVENVRRSFNDALEIMEIGRSVSPSSHLHVLENLLFENVCEHLHPHIVNKILQPAINKLARREQSNLELIACAETFVDNCMRFSDAAEKLFLHRNTVSARLNKLKELTGLDPVQSFRDAFIVKLLACYLRLNP